MLTIRPVSTMQDRKQVLALYEGAADYFKLTDQNYPSRATVEEDRTARPAALPADAKHFGLILADGDPIGVLDYLIGYPDATSLFIGLLLLPVANRRQGYGRQVVTQLLAAHPDVQRVRVGVADANEAGMAFWLALGFTFVSAGQASLGNGHVLDVTILDWHRE
ncbi:GNAT family N-acetyltransferase [Lacticaseibacillus daqingensis]|uniref:GNAT family N-acetyltransferase n=1 Tax=Lacticaseibacillus daqingensis TaxID=2486014 RepID=UPI0013DDAAD0|nr:GNAT family N-acetyltransferase [Lacticaseibacillus daqingensis]